MDGGALIYLLLGKVVKTRHSIEVSGVGIYEERKNEWPILTKNLQHCILGIHIMIYGH